MPFRGVAGVADGVLHRGSIPPRNLHGAVLCVKANQGTPGCSAQSCGFRDTGVEFAKLNAVVLGISILDSASKKKFADKLGLNFPLLADEEHAVLHKYGLWKEKSLYGKKYMGVSRETFLIDPAGRIAMHWPKAKGSEDHSAEVLEWLKEHV
ncbi:MAG: peroxiredoxin [Candidatus Sumerlaeia bacterium]|nr:peroxiredoxin [Candidatus Sumerlaeia bacterium]